MQEFSFSYQKHIMKNLKDFTKRFIVCQRSISLYIIDPDLSEWNFNPTSDRFHPAITWENQVSSRQGKTVLRLVFV